MSEGDSIHRAARRLGVLAGRTVRASAPHPRGRLARPDRIDGRRLDAVEALGKNLLLRFEGDLVLHSHLGMNGAWDLYRDGERWHRPTGQAWLVLDGDGVAAVQFGGPTLRLLSARAAARDPRLTRLGPDVLDPGFDPGAAVASLRRGGARRELGDALLEQTLVAGIGNIFKSEACWAARLDPWRRLGDLSDVELAEVLTAARDLMAAAVRSGRQPREVHRRARRPCPRCGGPLRSRGQGDANRTTYWCAGCQR